MKRAEYHLSVGTTLAVYTMFLVVLIVLFEPHVVTSILGLSVLAILHIAMALYGSMEE